MSGWSEYLLAWASFLGAHLVPAIPRIRTALIARLGRAGYLTAFSLVSLMLLLWLLRAAGRAPFLPLWDLGEPGRWLVNLTMPVAIFVAVSSPGLAGLVLAFALWSAAHLGANGDVAHVILFGGMLVFALSGVLRQGLPRALSLSPRRVLLAGAIWAALILLHPLVIGMSPLPG